MATGYAFAIRMGLEPTTSCVTGRRSNQLNYRTKDNKYTHIYAIESISRLKFVRNQSRSLMAFCTRSSIGFSRVLNLLCSEPFLSTRNFSKFQLMSPV